MLFNDDSIVAAVWRVTAVLLALTAEAWNIVNLFYSGERLTEHFGYFTVQSNLLYAAVLLFMLTSTSRPGWFAQLRGAATAYIILTGVIYAVLLAEPDELWSWNIDFRNLAHHRIVPIMAAVDWLLIRSPQPLRVRRAWLWMVYPLVYLGCSWIRWLVDGWVPYPFLDPVANGVVGLIPSTGQVIVAFLVGIVAVALTAQFSHPSEQSLSSKHAD